jgi:tripeptide aminopeptidase
MKIDDDIVLERFTRYVSIDTQSNEESKESPSTPGQLELARILEKELGEIGLSDITLDQNGYLMATLPSSAGMEDAPVIGFIAHLDTSPDMSGRGVSPRIFANYDGGDLVLDRDGAVTLSPEQFPGLAGYKGQTIITTDGSTLLGADDKAGITAIMSALAVLASDTDLVHGTIKVAFTPDEEIGRGAHLFEVERFGADYAYTIDGGPLGELEYENFNAANVSLDIQGRNVHPGSAMGGMINAVSIAAELQGLLPAAEKPEYTDGYQGFFHVYEQRGSVDHTNIKMLVRDHDRERFEERKLLLADCCELLRKKYPGSIITLDCKDVYYNMREKIMPVFEIIERAEKAFKQCGVEPVIKPIRGGTDGSQLSYKGLPTPNIFAGGHNFHGRYEFIPLESMVKSAEVIVAIATYH